MEVQVKRSYSEVYGILNMLGKQYIEKIPSKIYNVIESEREKDYNPKYNENQKLEEQNITDQALAMIMLLHFNYWSDEKEKQIIKGILIKNEKELEEKYNLDKIFEKKNNEIKEKAIENTTEEKKELVEYKENFIQKIINKIKNFFKKK